MNVLYVLSALLLIPACATKHESAPIHRVERAVLKTQFDQIQKSGTEIWANSLDPRTKLALSRYSASPRFGNSVRHLSIAGLSSSQVEEKIKSFKCSKIESSLMDVKTAKPLLCNGETVPQVIFDCPDGGLIRLKPKGDPCNRFRPQAHGSKSVKLRTISDPLNFSEEAFKVDEDGNPLPKSPADLARGLDPDAWAEDAHSDLVQE